MCPSNRLHHKWNEISGRLAHYRCALQPLCLATGYSNNDFNANDVVLGTICHNYYGHLNGTLETVLGAKPNKVHPFGQGC